MTQCADAADFNPQPDPPGKSTDNTRLHNPPGYKGAVIDPNDKANKGALVDPNEKPVKNTVIGPNDKVLKGVVIDPNVKKN